MSDSLVIMAMSEDGIAEGVPGENINMSLVGENMVIILPVQEMRLDGSGDIL